MARVRSKNSLPVLAVRKLVFGLGYRYRMHARELPGRPDLVFRLPPDFKSTEKEERGVDLASHGPHLKANVFRQERGFVFPL